MNEHEKAKDFIINDYIPTEVRQLSKVCAKCKTEKPINKFYKNKMGYYSTYCIACHLGYNMNRCMSGGNRKNLKVEIINHYSNGKNCCTCCGEAHVEFLTIDHVNGGGTSHKRKSVGNSNDTRAFYKYLIRNDFPNNPPLQVLCFNCNIAKGLYGICPHKRKKDSSEVIPTD